MMMDCSFSLVEGGVVGEETDTGLSHEDTEVDGTGEKSQDELMFIFASMFTLNGDTSRSTVICTGSLQLSKA